MSVVSGREGDTLARLAEAMRRIPDDKPTFYLHGERAIEQAVKAGLVRAEDIVDEDDE